MTLVEQGNRLRAEIEGMEAGSARRYEPAQRRRILKWVDRAVRGGMSESDCCKLLGIAAKRLSLWRAKQPARSKALVRVEVSDEAAPGSSISFVSPSGYWIDGLTMEQVIALMRAFA